MRRSAAVVVVVLGALLLVPAPARAQGFWRYFERLSGPAVSGPGFELSVICQAVRRSQPQGDRTWFASLQCADASRDRPWINVGLQAYRLGGENDLTADREDRVDVIGVAPFADLNFPPGVAVGGGIGLRRISAAAGSFNSPVGEVAVKFRPGRFAAWLRSGSPGGLAAPTLGRDFFEVRAVAVFEGEFESGRFGPDARAVDGGVNFGLVLAFNLISAP